MSYQLFKAKLTFSVVVNSLCNSFSCIRISSRVLSLVASIAASISVFCIYPSPSASTTPCEANHALDLLSISMI
jgi:hypothetical protein